MLDELSMQETWRASALPNYWDIYLLNQFVSGRMQSDMETESSCSILRSLKLDDIEEVVSEAYYQDGAGRPPRKPIGIFKALTGKRVKLIPSDRKLYRLLWADPDLRETCDIEAE